jgi:glycosyltransferase involved in cell wall biosynthesis
MNVVASLLRKPERDFDLVVACFSANNDCWIEVPPDQFLEITGLAVASGKFDDPDWRAALTDLYALLAVGEPLKLHPGTILIDMGTPWLRKNYFLMVRSAKAQFGVRYISFVHDCIPLLTPQHCAREHTQDFTSWIIGVFHHSDGFLVNSNATANDLVSIARRLGHSAPVPAVIRLDASFSFDRDVGNDKDDSDGCIVARHAVDRTGFVLFVSTIESRKNHSMAFDAWLSLIKIRGFRKTPVLVCVGNLGWLNDATMERLTSNRLLKRKVLILSNVSDAALVTLYRRCLFTLYPSSYEGWGLPITESLGHGKVPLTSRASSLPEAGGDFAEYFDLDSERDFVEKLLRLIHDRSYREAREAMIRMHFRPRSWTEVADEIVARVTAPDAVPEPRPPTQQNQIWPLPIEIGRYYSMSRNLETTVWTGMISGEMYRMGRGWGPPGDWGVWLKRDHADIAFLLPEGAKGGYAIYLGLRARPEKSTNFEITVVGTASRLDGTLAAGEDRWVILSLETGAFQTDEVQIRLSAAGTCEVAGTEANRRAASLGVIGFYLCARADAAAHDRFFELLRQNRLDTLSGRPIDERH